MKILSIMAFLMASLLTINAAAQTDEAQVEKIAKDALKGYNDKNIVALFANAADNIVIAGPFNQFVVGVEAGKSMYNQLFKTQLKNDRGAFVSTKVVLTSNEHAQVLVNMLMQNTDVPNYKNPGLINIGLTKIAGNWKISSITVVLNPHQSLVDLAEAQH